VELFRYLDVHGNMPKTLETLLITSRGKSNGELGAGVHDKTFVETLAEYMEMGNASLPHYP